MLHISTRQLLTFANRNIVNGEYSYDLGDDMVNSRHCKYLKKNIWLILLEFRLRISKYDF